MVKRSWCIGSVLMGVLVSMAAHAQDVELQQLADQFRSPWVIGIKKSSPGLVVPTAVKVVDQGVVVDALFGQAGREKQPVSSLQIMRNDKGGFDLALVAQQGPRYAMQLDAAGRWVSGTRTRPNEEPQAMSSFRPLAKDEASPVCGGLAGMWAGRWSQGGFGVSYLDVLVTSDGCKAYKDGESAVVDVTDGKLTGLKCSTKIGATCEFSLHGQDLWASYRNAEGGSNSAVFRRVGK